MTGVSDQLDSSWDSNAAAWTATVRERLIESRRVATDAAILNAIRDLAPHRVLDIGCGEGWLCRALQQAGVACVGVDGSVGLVDAARTADPDGVYHVLRYTDFGGLNDLVAPGSCDVAVCNFSLLHDDIAPVLHAARAALRAHGTLLIQTVHPWSASDGDYTDGWRTEDFAWAERRFPQAMPWYFRTLQSWVDIVRASGFTLQALDEPKQPETGKLLSLMLRARA
jgi:2-polyprenyl-3-methyl-5-hydroxy-6-metoxy-1,4-benzoquinol methylase